ncbi:carbohydrate ABC transporter permease [Rhizobium sp. VS19-DR104.2]|uniref:carbohydrate ABC transporter permease n=1 Tax=unclassified Rhizobium TaxID=2613769 RepID=UPI001C5B4968|nr:MULTISPECIES: carbohydrate ABC transporter permease [unclassified Rhizobium]MBZ5763232.1 carbohydrate ABC transporter permease [Rhizobium sp. VS19-DR96]MBZ5769170.1 carbohydrate ABC transporter permease [Rhizobium sp. VS19-DR129.2]MBZ5776702.1 carbohydrate ABC transporter permease [Rhizobium sp. VS19-DRK62.2]MBZ5787819.1 carbohydrate ABC transporter permease [Rhizobium sp. VS19-DR121]MBZ5805214.1 carbohydrate ABC transporter permease [Rhizobium sp. VS19-DR181]
MTDRGHVGRSLLCWLALSPLILLNLFPFAVMLFTALKPADEVVASVEWLPHRFAWQNFIDMWHSSNFGQALWNSLYVSVGSTLLATLISIPAAYAMSRFRFSFKQPYSDFLLVTQMLSPIVLVLGLFRLVVWLGLVDSISTVVVIYTAFQIAFAVWMMRGYFDSIPADLEESAWLEGASRLRSLRSVFLPLSVPAIAVTGIFTFINAWNEFALALTLLRKEEHFTLPIQIFSMVAGRYEVEWHYVMAATLVATLPVAVLFAWLQRFLIGGLSSGAVK